MPFLVLIMAIQLRLYNFAKKENSTAHPAGTDPYNNYMCNLKDDTSILHPIFLLRPEEQNWNPSLWTYAYVNIWHKYYFVDDVQWKSPYWELHLSIDALATYKTEILASTRYVLRSASSYNVHLLDNAYVPTDEMIIKNETVTLPNYTDTDYDIFKSHRGVFVLGVVGHPDSSSESDTPVSYYVLNRMTFAKFLQYLYTNILNMDWQSNSDWNAVISKSFIDPLDYIISCFYVPFNLRSQEFSDWCISGGQDINFGFWQWTDDQLGIGKMRARVFTQQFNINIPTNPYHLSDMDWEMLPPFAEYYLNLGVGGIHKLNALSATLGDGLKIHISYDVGTGMAVYDVYPKLHNTIIMRTSAQFFPPVPIGRQKSDILGMLTNIGGNIAGGIAAGVTGGPIGVVAGGVIGTGKALISAGLDIAKSDALNTFGSIGSMAALTGDISLSAEYKNHQLENNADLGRPCCKNVQLSTLSGFTVCADGEIDNAGMLAEERELINKYLTSGFYIA